MLKDYYGHSKYPNGNRTPAERRARYCFLRQLGMSRTETRIAVNFRDSVTIRYIEQRGKM